MGEEPGMLVGDALPACRGFLGGGSRLYLLRIQRIT
jgi:hypothetical protein